MARHDPGAPEPLLLGCHVHGGLLDTKGSNEDVDHDDDEDQTSGQVVEEVQLGMLGRVVEVIPNKEDEQHAHSNLQREGDGDEDHQGDEEGEARALLNDSLQLGGVGHQQCDVQHALSCALLVGIMVHVDGLVPAPAARRGARGSGRARAQVALSSYSSGRESMVRHWVSFAPGLSVARAPAAHTDPAAGPPTARLPPARRSFFLF